MSIAMLLLRDRKEVEHMLLICKEIFGIHLLETERGTRFSRREIIQASIYFGPCSFLTHNTITSTVCSHLTEKSIQINLFASQSRRSIGHILIDYIELFEFVDEMSTVLFVVRTLLLEVNSMNQTDS